MNEIRNTRWRTIPIPRTTIVLVQNETCTRSTPYDDSRLHTIRNRDLVILHALALH